MTSQIGAFLHKNCRNMTGTTAVKIGVTARHSSPTTLPHSKPKTSKLLKDQRPSKQKPRRKMMRQKISIRQQSRTFKLATALRMSDAALLLNCDRRTYPTGAPAESDVFFAPMLF
jgi:hypothetical protein